jgi:acetyl-CoA C-acetyltransferase
MDDKNNPVIIGAAQFTQRKNTPQPLDSLSLMVKTGQKAIEDIHTKEITEFIDAVYMVNISSWSYEDAPGELSKKLNITPKEKVYLPDGGQSPQMLVNRAAEAITSGKHRAVLITGGEAAYSIRKRFKEEPPEYWPKKEDPKYMNGKSWKLAPITLKYQLYIPTNNYAIFETALRASSGRNIEEHERYMGKLFEHFSKIASKNPYSWTQKQYCAEEIITPSPENRRVVYPYTKRMCANNLVDQAATIIVTSEKIAESLNIDKKKWIYIMGGATLRNIGEIYQRPQLYDSPAIRKGYPLALEQAGLKLSDIDKFDLYSCFPSIVEIMMNELGIKEDDPRDLTLTGGLPFFGTPLSNYSLHAIINTVESIRADPALKVMIIANGGFNTKQSIGIYGTEPPMIQWGVRDDSKVQESILNEILPEPVEEAYGKLTVVGYSFHYDRSGQPKRGIVIGNLENGRRTLAFVIQPELLLTLETQEIVGKTCRVQYDPNIERNIIVSIEQI